MADKQQSSELAKPNHYNYDSWKNEIRTLLQSVDAYDIALGEETIPTDNTPTIRKDTTAQTATWTTIRPRSVAGLRTLLSPPTPFRLLRQ